MVDPLDPSRLTGAELAALDRTFDFVPAVNASPRVLTRGQIDRFNDVGYVGPCDGLSAAEMLAFGGFVDRILAEALARGESSYSINSAHLRFGAVYDLLGHPRIVGCVSDLLGANVIGWGARIFCKLPHDPQAIDWHQDAAYWALSAAHGVSVWLAIDDAEPDNAAMQFIAGSHRRGLLAHQSNPSPTAPARLAVDRQEYEGHAPATVALRAGQFSIHSDLLLHGSPPNTSARRRCGLSLRYTVPEVIPYLGWERRGIVVSGDVRGGWANPARP